MSKVSTKSKMSRREVLGTAATAAVMTPIVQSAIVSCVMAADAPLNGIAGIDRVTILPGKTYLRG